MSVDEIKSAIRKLTSSERGELEDWLHESKDDQWDQQIADDASKGRLDKLLAEVDREIDDDRLGEMP